MKTTNYLFTMLALIGGTFVSQSAYALRNTQPLVVVSPQQQVVKGVVVDKKGEPIVGATVSVVGKTMGVITDINGKFSLHVPNETKLRVTYVGYKTIIVMARPNMQIALDEDAGQLSEVVVVGYGTQKKTNLTGAVANIDVKEAIASRPITDVGKALQGITPGLTIINKIGGVGN